MDPAPRHGHGRVLYQRRARPVQLRTKAMNARIVDSVGIETHRILLMVNTKMKHKKCECCKKPIYKDEFYLANDGEIVCIKCLINKGDTDNL